MQAKRRPAGYASVRLAKIKMKTITKIGLAFLLVGFSLQLYAYFYSSNSTLQGSAIACLMLGIALEIIGYAFDEKPKNK